MTTGKTESEKTPEKWVDAATGRIWVILRFKMGAGARYEAWTKLGGEYEIVREIQPHTRKSVVVDRLEDYARTRRLAPIVENVK